MGEPLSLQVNERRLVPDVRYAHGGSEARGEPNTERETQGGHMVRTSRERISAVDKAYKLIWDVHYALWNNRTQSQPLQKPTLRETRMGHVLQALDEQWDCVKRLGFDYIKD